MPQPDEITVKVAADIIGISERALIGRIKRGSIDARAEDTPRGKVWYIKRTEAEASKRNPAGRKKGDNPNVGKGKSQQ